MYKLEIYLSVKFLDLHIQFETLYLTAAKYLEDNSQQKGLTATHLGKLCINIKEHLSEEMREIDKLVKRVLG